MRKIAFFSTNGGTLFSGKSVDEALQISNREISDYLKLPPVKMHCSMLAEDAIKMAQIYLNLLDFSRHSLDICFWINRLRVLP